jgi:hypothetical protein
MGADLVSRLTHGTRVRRMGPCVRLCYVSHIIRSGILSSGGNAIGVVDHAATGFHAPPRATEPPIVD